MKPGSTGRALALSGAWLGCVHCGRALPSTSVDSAAGSSVSIEGGASRPADGALHEDPREAELWTRAGQGDLVDLERLYTYAGADGLIEQSKDPSRRLPAVRALAFADDFYALPFLATVATSGGDAEAFAALESVVTMASAPRRAVDPEDALELRDGCADLLALAKDGTRPAPRRGLAIVALRLLVDRGCVARADVPTELDAR